MQFKIFKLHSLFSNRIFVLVLSLLTHTTGLMAQPEEDLLGLLGDSAKTEVEYVNGTFKGTRLINLHTVEITDERNLDFRISHRFGSLNSGFNNFYGLDGGASIKLSLDYSFDGRFQFGIARNSYEKLYEGLIKYKVLQQTEDGKMPITLTVLGVANVNGQEDKGIVVGSTTFYKYKPFANRMSYTSQVMIARKFNEKLSVQISPTYIHYNLVETIAQRNDNFNVAALARYMLSNRTGVTFEYGYSVMKFQDGNTYKNHAGIGFDIETGGHVFQVFLVNSFGMNEAQFLQQNTNKWSNASIRLGFNISRVFLL